MSVLIPVTRGMLHAAGVPDDAAEKWLRANPQGIVVPGARVARGVSGSISLEADPPAKRRRVQREAMEQQKVIAWADNPAVRNRWPVLAFLFHPMNGGQLAKPRQRALAASLGVRPGVPDLWLPVPCWNTRRVGLVIELKAPGGVASPEQRKWLLDLEGLGWAAFLEVGADAAIARITQFLERRGA